VSTLHAIDIAPGSQFTRDVTGDSPSDDRDDDDDDDIMAALDTIGARLTGRTRRGRRSARGHGRPRVQGLRMHGKSVNPVFDGPKQLFQFGRDCAVESYFVAHA